MIDQATYLSIRPMPVFKPELRQANRDGLKSQTRRVVEPQITWQEDIFQRRKSGTIDQFTYSEFMDTCPYGKAGDYCYMREPLMRGFGDVAYYADDNRMVRHVLTGEPITWRWKRDLLTSIFMPREAARLIYRYVEIRVEKVQDISRNDAKAEGAKGVWKNPPENKDHYTKVLLNPYVANYSIIWDKINAERGYPWNSNPWVWVLKYKPLEVRGD